jgi:hypothetical protein
MAVVGSATRPRVVIFRGGFAGVYTALAIEKALGERDDFEVVLVNRANYFVYKPVLNDREFDPWRHGRYVLPRHGTSQRERQRERPPTSQGEHARGSVSDCREPLRSRPPR